MRYHWFQKFVSPFRCFWLIFLFCFRCFLVGLLGRSLGRPVDAFRCLLVCLGVPWAAPGSLLGAFWPAWASAGHPLGPTWLLFGTLGSPWGTLGPSSASFASPLGVHWAPFGLDLAASRPWASSGHAFDSSEVAGRSRRRHPKVKSGPWGITPMGDHNKC